MKPVSGPSKEVRTGRIDWGRAPSAIAFVDVLREDNSSSFLMMQPVRYRHHLRELPSDFKYLNHQQIVLTVPEEVLQVNKWPDTPDAAAYDVFHISNRPSTHKERKYLLNVRTEYNFFGLGSGWCYLCFPPKHYVPDMFSQGGPLWVWGDDLLSVGCNAPLHGVAFNFDYNSAQYRTLVGPGPFNLWETGRRHFDFDQSFLHVAICKTVEKHRNFPGVAFPDPARL